MWAATISLWCVQVRCALALGSSSATITLLDDVWWCLIFRFAYAPYQVLKRCGIKGPTPVPFFGNYREETRMVSNTCMPLGWNAYTVTVIYKVNIGYAECKATCVSPHYTISPQQCSVYVTMDLWAGIYTLSACTRYYINHLSVITTFIFTDKTKVLWVSSPGVWRSYWVRSI